MLLSLERFNVQRQLGSSSGGVVENEGEKEELVPETHLSN